MATCIAKFEWGWHIDGSVDITFTNCLTGVTETRHYKTEAAAKGAVTKIGNRLARIYGQQRAEEIDVHTPLDAYFVEVI